MKKPIHGGGVDQAMAELAVPREAIYDFSASINPLGTPLEVELSLVEALRRIGDYPEIEAASLRAELARFHKIPEQQLLAGSGSTELIYLLPRVLRPRRGLLVQPCFSEYAPALQQAGCQVDNVYLSPENDFRFCVEGIFNALSEDTDLVLLANPGNPTGVHIDPPQLRDLARRIGTRRLLVDEAFIDFCPQHSVLPLVQELDNLLVLRSMTKFYAIPGLRVGYLAGATADVARLSAAKEPWTLSNLAIAAGKACLGATDYQQKTLALIPRLRDELRHGLEALGCRVFPSAANYLLCRLPENRLLAAALADRLRQQGVLIRDCADFAPLDRHYFRVAVLSAEANQQLLKYLATILD